MTSLRQRTLGLTLLVFGLSVLVIGYISYRYAAQEIEELYDASLSQNARLLEGFLRAPLPEADRDVLLESLARALSEAEGASERADSPLYESHRYESPLVFQLWEGDSLLLRSTAAPTAALNRQPPGYSSLEVENQAWRVYTLSVPETDRRVVVGEREDVRDELIARVALRTLMPDLLGLPLLTALLWWSIGWGLSPLSRMAEQIRNRDPNNLKPLSREPLPLELATIAGALDRLLERVGRLRAREKRFIADATHELRTPLAVLDLHAQNALAADNAEDRGTSLTLLRDGVARATRLVGQLLTLARLDPDVDAPPAARRIDVAFETRETLAKLSPLAAKSGHQLLMNVDPHASWQMDEEPGAIETLIQNLVGNALQHAPSQTTVTVTLKADAKTVTVLIDDQGPGIIESERLRALERFQRAGPGAGAGLGLSIVGRLVTRHSGELSLEDAPDGGLRVRAVLARHAAATPS
ncbi:ATP-binding protein [Halomonas sp. PAMB 3264]|uniref:ATP-binding protein n=1 Tax=Halomonas sp. PAMB 3264 TaxID=3075222 RepID=UPI00289D337E|nr:ATP-binding protein [Halomonas sp. PAMB 3264]WNL42325.1 ATP-binding protein [Halomonas sp. PAMB 3264]